MKYTFFSACLGISAAVVIFWLIRKNLLYVRYAVWWLCVASSAVLLGFYPQLTDLLARIFGIGYPPVIVLSVAVVVLLIKILSMDIERSQQEIRLRRMVQRLALLQSAMDDHGIVIDDSDFPQNKEASAAARSAVSSTDSLS